MEIERKFLVKSLPSNLEDYPFKVLEQAYLCVDPVVRIRREDSDFYLTYKGKGLLAREEYNLPLTQDAYEHLLKKADGTIIKKRRYLIPIPSPVFSPSFTSPSTLELTIELDLFEAPYDSLIIAEVEFESKDMAHAFQMPDWFLEDVTMNPEYYNSNLSKSI